MSLTPDERAQLTHFAHWRLMHFGVNHHRDEDLLHHAYLAVLKGLAGKGGRLPKAKDVESRQNFLNYLRGVINSIVEGWARANRHKHEREHCPLELLQEVLGSPHNAIAQIESQDFKARLFEQLWNRAPARLMPTVEAWKQDAEHRIPVVTSRKHTAAVQKLAQQIAQELRFFPHRPAGDKSHRNTVVT